MSHQNNSSCHRQDRVPFQEQLPPQHQRGNLLFTSSLAATLAVTVYWPKWGRKLSIAPLESL